MNAHKLSPSVFEPSLPPPVSPLYPISPLKKSAYCHPKMTQRFAQSVDHVRTHVSQVTSYNSMQGPTHVPPHRPDSKRGGGVKATGRRAAAGGGVWAVVHKYWFVVIGALAVLVAAYLATKLLPCGRKAKAVSVWEIGTTLLLLGGGLMLT